MSPSTMCYVQGTKIAIDKFNGDNYDTWRNSNGLSESERCWCRFITKVDKQFNARVNSVRHDGTNEFKTTSLLTYYNDHGINVQPTDRYAHQTNATAERANRTIVASGRSMLHYAGLDKSFWAEAAMTAIYTKNRLPSPKSADKTPFEIIYKSKPNVKHMRIFGDKGYVLTPKEMRLKWDPKAHEIIFLGYDERSKAHPVRDIEAVQVVNARDVTFDESRFDDLEVIDDDDFDEVTDSSDGLQFSEDSGPKVFSAPRKPNNEVGTKWVFKIKRNTDGSIERYEVLLVAKYFVQKYGIDYTDTFSSVVKYVTRRMIIAITNYFGWPIDEPAVVDVFVYGLMKEKVFYTVPDGVELDDGFDCVGFSRQFTDSSKLREFGTRHWARVKRQLKSPFEKTDSGKCSFILGIEIIDNADGIVMLSQGRYINDILECFVIQDCKPATSPADISTKLVSSDSTTKLDAPFREAVGALMHMMTSTRPDIAFADGGGILVAAGRATPELKIFKDNQSCSNMAKVSVNHDRTKHVDIKYHHIRDEVKRGEVIVEYSETATMLADIKTTGLAGPRHKDLTAALGIHARSH
ncbi:unnamed protein product [Phytophthora fragariaefolia]|uniref:Unnamed protein product n=1 Tax=Phytophthora fragariaefolia TaxID=1490495 RepID=A0A9W7CYP5_9STRA|nr:unnamed protein product [Phytophthora fragariaefolia]